MNSSNYCSFHGSRGRWQPHYLLPRLLPPSQRLSSTSCRSFILMIIFMCSSLSSNCVFNADHVPPNHLSHPCIVFATYPLFILFFQLASGKAATCPVIISMGRQFIGTRVVCLDGKRFSFVLRCCVYHLFTHCRLHCTVQTLHHCLHRLRSSSRRGGRRTDCFWPSAT